jgi:hypothetical protein
MASKKSRAGFHAPLRIPARECASESLLSVRFKCGCRLSLSSGQVFLILPKDPTVGNRKRYLGHIDGNGTLHIHRDGRDFLRARQVYGLNVHLLLSAGALGFNEIYCDTPARGGYLPPIGKLLGRKQFQYRAAGFEVQVGFGLKEIRGAA